MESIYYSITFACHRKCVHCYEDKFRPYVRKELEAVVAQSVQTFPRVVDNLPDSLLYRDGTETRVGRIILSGGEVLIEAVREPVLYPLIEALGARYRDRGGVKLVVQTTGDLLTPTIIADLTQRGVWMISVAGMDDFHVGMEGEKRSPLKERLTQWFEAAGMHLSGLQAGTRRWHEEEGPLYSFFGATPDAWIGKLWPRGRAWLNDLSTATIEDNFCNRWSGGLNFMNHGVAGSEVAIAPDGSLYPCCLKTAVPLGNLTEERLIDILDSLKGHPAFEAINRGEPEIMGETLGWDRARFLANSRTRTPKGRDYQNLCIGCDAFHRDVLGPEIAKVRARRLAARRSTSTPALAGNPA